MQETTLVAPERLDAYTASTVEAQARELLVHMEDCGGKLVVDLSRSTRIDSAGLHALVRIRDRAARRRIGVSLRGVSEQLRRLLVLRDHDSLFEIE